MFSGPRANYTVTTTGGDGTLGSPGSTTTVVHNGAGADGTDTLRNIERLASPTPRSPAHPSSALPLAGNGQATVTWTAPAVGTVDGYSVKVLDPPVPRWVPCAPRPAGATSLVVTGLTNGSKYRFQVWPQRHGASPFSALSNAVSPTAATVAGAPTIGTTAAGMPRRP